MHSVTDVEIVDLYVSTSRLLVLHPSFILCHIAVHVAVRKRTQASSLAVLVQPSEGYISFNTYRPLKHFPFVPRTTYGRPQVVKPSSHRTTAGGSESTLEPANPATISFSQGL